MKTERNKLPESWCVRNDGSQRFKETVIKYLNVKYNKRLMGSHSGFYGFNGTFVFDVSQLDEYFNCEVLTVDEFVYLSGVDCKQVGSTLIAIPTNDPRPVTMTIEVARDIYKDCIEFPSLASGNYKRWLLENFTKEELEGKEGFTWEESYGPDGFWIDDDSIIQEERNGVAANMHKKVFLTEKQALSALAFAQLSHIVAKYNEGKVKDKKYCSYAILCARPGLVALQVAEVVDNERLHLTFNRPVDAMISLKVNRELWEQYWML